MSDPSGPVPGAAPLPDAVQEGWAPYLDPGERVLWQGRPDPGFHVRPASWALAAFGLVFSGFAAFWMLMAARGGGGLWAFGLLHFSVGAGLVVVALFWDTWQRRHSWYAVTNRRAFVATDIPLQGRRLRSWPIRPETPLDVREGPLGDVYFAAETRRRRGGSYSVPVGFERLPEARAVAALLRKVQRGEG